jgi:hypothetical protein
VEVEVEAVSEGYQTYDLVKPQQNMVAWKRKDTRRHPDVRVPKCGNDLTNYPQHFPILNVLGNWAPDDPSEPAYIYDTLCRFNFRLDVFLFLYFALEPESGCEEERGWGGGERERVCEREEERAREIEREKEVRRERGRESEIEREKEVRRERGQEMQKRTILTIFFAALLLQLFHNAVIHWNGTKVSFTGSTKCLSLRMIFLRYLP